MASCRRGSTPVRRSRKGWTGTRSYACSPTPTEGDRPGDVRARAILVVLITYGLRAGEVAGLRLEDLDWIEVRLRVRCPKPGRTHN